MPVGEMPGTGRDRIEVLHDDVVHLKGRTGVAALRAERDAALVWTEARHARRVEVGVGRDGRGGHPVCEGHGDVGCRAAQHQVDVRMMELPAGTESPCGEVEDKVIDRQDPREEAVVVEHGRGVGVADEGGERHGEGVVGYVRVGRHPL